MSDPIEDLIREIATKHGIAVSRDDPILVLQTINSRLLQDSAKAQQVQLDAYKQEMEASAHQWANDAKEKAERILNASLNASNDAVAAVMMKGSEAVGERLQSELEALIARLSRPIIEAQRLAMVNIAASIITMLAAAVALWAGL